MKREMTLILFLKPYANLTAVLTVLAANLAVLKYLIIAKPLDLYNNIA